MLTPEEEKWVKRVQRALDACPSNRIGFYTIGDARVTLYDKSKDAEIQAGGERDFGQLVDAADADFFRDLRFPSLVHSVSG